jgi:hypothetical protein
MSILYCCIYSHCLAELWISLWFSAVASVSIKMKKHVAAAICGDVDAYPNPWMADGSGKRPRSLRAPSRRGVRGDL